jgi:hypothetical protein
MTREQSDEVGTLREHDWGGHNWRREGLKPGLRVKQCVDARRVLGACHSGALDGHESHDTQDCYMRHPRKPPLGLEVGLLCCGAVT